MTKADGTRSDAGLHRTSMIWLDPKDLVIIGLDTEDGPEHYLYDARIRLAVSDADMANVREFGVLKPIIIQRDGDRWLVVDGRQRVRRARAAADLQTQAGESRLAVPCVTKRGTAERTFALSRAANSGHVESSPLMLANDAQRLIDHGMSQAQAGETMGVSQATISAWLSLLTLSSKVKSAVDTGKVSPSAASKLAKLTAAEQDEALAGLLAAGPGKATTERAKNAAKVAKGEAPVITPKGRIVQAASILGKIAAVADKEATDPKLYKLLNELAQALLDSKLSELPSETKA